MGLDAAGHPILRLANRGGEESWLKVELLARHPRMPLYVLQA
ncbi:hypothetical protein [Hyalangium gracile]|nr:hypothetical protein [Hyalangium gracile]